MKNTTDWHERFLGLAKEIASWSKDPSTQFGAVIVDPKGRIVSMGYNGFPQRVRDDERLHNREEKYEIIIHAEINALIFAKQSVEGCTLYTWPFMPCSRCAAIFIQAGIEKVVAPRIPAHLEKRWAKNVKLSHDLFVEAGVRVIIDVDPQEQ